MPNKHFIFYFIDLFVTLSVLSHVKMADPMVWSISVWFVQDAIKQTHMWGSFRQSVILFPHSLIPLETASNVDYADVSHAPQYM